MSGDYVRCFTLTLNTLPILTLVRLYGSAGDGIGYSLNQDRPQVLRVMTRRGGTFSQLEKSKEWISLDICDFRSDLLLFNVETGNSYWKGRRSTVVLLLKIVCLYKNIKKYIQYKKQLIWSRRLTAHYLPLLQGFPGRPLLQGFLGRSLISRQKACWVLIPLKNVNQGRELIINRVLYGTFYPG